MTLSIPDGLFDKYREAADWFIDNDNIGRNCLIIYPPKRTSCDNCITKMIGSTTTSVYRHGGPAPFSFGDCPMCGGNGYSEEESTDTIRLRVYWNRKDWVRITDGIGVDDADVMAIGYMSDISKVKRSIEIKLVSDNNEAEYRATVTGQPTPWGFGRNRYFVVFLKGA